LAGLFADILSTSRFSVIAFDGGQCVNVRYSHC